MTFPDGIFWDDEAMAIWDEVAPFMVALIHAGGEEGADMLPETISAFIGWDYFNEKAIEYLKSYRLGWVDGISETTRKQSMATIANWIEAGESLPALDARLTPLLGASRAKQIAITEVTRIFAKGNQLAWEATGLVTEKVFRTAEDEKVCPICGPLANTTVGISELFYNSPTDIANSPQMAALESDPDKRMAKASALIRSVGAYAENPPLHPRCRCRIQPVVTEVGLERELEKILNKTEVTNLMADLRIDERIIIA